MHLKWPLNWPLIVLMSAVMTIGSASGAFAQLQGGDIFGTVEDDDGAVLEGVTVTGVGPENLRPVVTDDVGIFRFVDLAPGYYTLEAAREGFSTVISSGVQVDTGRTTTVTIDLRADKDYTITVTAETALLDVRNVGAGTVFTEAELREIPSGRDPWAVLRHVPGIFTDRLDVGGSAAGTQAGVISGGAATEQTVFYLDGIEITDVESPGRSPFYFDFGALEEIRVVTGSSDPRFGSPGVHVNLVTGRGTDELLGSARMFLSDDWFQTDPIVPAVDPDDGVSSNPREYLEGAGGVGEITEYGLEAGGPLLDERLWGWGAWSEREIETFSLQPAGYENPFRTRTELDNVAVRLNGSITSHNNIEGAYWRSGERASGVGVGARRDLAAGWNSTPFGDRDNYRFEDSHLFSPELYLSGSYSKINHSFEQIPDSGEGCRTIECSRASGSVAHFDLSRGLWSETFSHHQSSESLETFRADGGAFVGGSALTHELGFGFGYREGISSSSSGWPGDQFVISDEGSVDTVALVRSSDANFITKATDFYLGDTVLLGRATIQFGLRYDLQNGTGRPGRAEQNPLIPEVLPGLQYEPAAGGVVQWEDFSPRFGATYTLGDEHRLLLRAGYNRYIDRLGSELVKRSTPLGRYQFALYEFDDVNGNGRAEREELLFDEGPFGNGIVDWSGLDPASPAADGPFYRYAPDLQAPRTDEIILGVEYEVLPEFTVRLDVADRTYKDAIWEAPEKGAGSGELYSSEDYEPAGMLTQTLPGGDTTTVTHYALRSGVPPPVYFVLMNRPDYERKFEGIELSLVKRLSNGWMARAFVSANQSTQEIGTHGVIDPTPLLTEYGCSSCDGSTVGEGPGNGVDDRAGAFVTPGWAYGVAALYQIPFIDLDVSLSMFARNGYPLPYVHSVSSSEGRKYVLVDGVEAGRLDDVFQLDLRLAKAFPVSDDFRSDRLPRGFQSDGSADGSRAGGRNLSRWTADSVRSAHHESSGSAACCERDCG